MGNRNHIAGYHRAYMEPKGGCMNIIDAAKAVLGSLGNGPIYSNYGFDGLKAMEALRKAVAEAEGMVLVPSEPTREMYSAGALYGDGENVHADIGLAVAVYKAMLAAAEVKP